MRLASVWRVEIEVRCVPASFESTLSHVKLDSMTADIDMPIFAAACNHVCALL